MIDADQRIREVFRQLTGRKTIYYINRLVPLAAGMTQEQLADTKYVIEQVANCIQKMRKTKMANGKMEFTGPIKKNNNIYLTMDKAEEIKVVTEDYLIENKEMYKDYLMGKDRGVSIVRDGATLLFNEEYWRGIDLQEYNRLCVKLNNGRVMTTASIGLRTLLKAVGSLKEVFGEAPIKPILHQAEVIDKPGTYLRSEGKGVYEIDATAAYLQIFTNDRLPKNKPIGDKVIEGYIEPTDNIIYKYELTGGRTVWYNNGWRGSKPASKGVLQTYRYMPVSKKHSNIIKDFGSELLRLRKEPNLKGLYKQIANSLIGKISYDAPVAVQYIYDIARSNLQIANRYIESQGFTVQANHTDSVRFYGPGDVTKLDLTQLPYEWRLESTEPLDCISYNRQVQVFRDKDGNTTWKHSGIRGICPEFGTMPEKFEWSRLKVSNDIKERFSVEPNSHTVTIGG